MGKDYYKILEVDRGTTPDEIKKAFYKKAHEYHPDKPGGNAEKFKEINEAYQVLGNLERKKQYDQFGTTFEGFGGQGAYEAGFDWADLFRQGGFGRAERDGRGTSEFRMGGFDFDFGDLSDLFSDFFGGAERDSQVEQGGTRRSSRVRRTTRARPGQDIEIDLTIDFSEAAFGAEKILDITKLIVCSHCQGSGAEPGAKMESCKTCKGSGQVVVTQQTFFGAFQSVSTCQACLGEGRLPSSNCGVCLGKGRVKGKERIKVKIPAGIAAGETLKLSGKGEAGEKGGTAGDLYINIRLRPHPEFKRVDDDIYSTVYLSFTQACLGAKVRVKTLKGEVNLKIPASTPSGKEFILRGEGVPRLHGHGRGDQIMTVKVRVPDNLTKSQKKLLEELAREGL